MSIAERARTLAEKLMDKGLATCTHEIEQALLAERRLAMEEAAKQLEEYGAAMQGNSANHSLGAAFNRIFQERAQVLRAAAAQFP